ncbi:MAG TPA: hypothetical protein VK492_09575 [Chitinophagaceae bacterium]|nr:hypothetical protein [Chitinophagaceae bacterium]
MEVHAHTHTPRKKWTHYLWEFLMLFLAVFAGFLAENQREHQVEHQRERTYMKTLIQDIALDIGELDSCISFRLRQEKRIDSLLYLLKNHRDSLNDIYFFARWSTRTNDLFYNDRTMQQLKNSGGLRLIRNEEVSEKIILYDARIRQIIGYRQPLENESRQDLRHIYSKVMDGEIFNNMLSDDPNVFAIRPQNNPKLFSSSPELINELVMEAQYLKSIYTVTRKMDANLVEFGKGLIALIKNEYNLK